ncbi:DUF3006 domain-containing protein [Alkalihalophilus marmarensis]|jgi:hypothetical protein|uniref:DUF3006 domain-containing protein n=1 Tax=Alkalihalophilus marmarensis DSM 21297 TaxID=1188261 RepID=U6SHS6_9BACI|nr:DUF3006 domain-containing protein [Alkalihalophilus marmarensis]ERN51284.1 hypothetical protein A33I_20610 [Alkalihalophilus marmarensis DSM 21297]MCM3491578.1 DUF3006 domain-containing protein [Alkalihalophilus marmarensis]
MKVNGVLDRIVDSEYGVILVEELDKEYVVKKEMLPDGVSEGDWLTLLVEGGEIQSVEIDLVKTESVKSKVEAQVERLRKKSKGSRFKRK